MAETLLDARTLLEKEIQGLTAKLKWDHLDESIKENYRLRILDLRAQLKPKGP